MIKNKHITAFFCLCLSLTTSLTSCGSFVDDAKDFVQDAGNNVASWAQDAGENVVDWAQDAGENVVDWAQDAGSAITQWGSDTFNYFSNGQFGNDFMSFSSKSWKTISEWSAGVGKHIGDFYTSFHDGVVAFFLKQGVNSINLTKKQANLLNATDYAGDPETMALGVFTNYLKQSYHTFYASVADDNGDEIYGIGYTDYKESYSSDQLDLICSGFIAVGEENGVSLSDSEIRFIKNIETSEDDQNSAYYLGYTMDPFESHFIGHNKYVQFGVTDTQSFFYKTDQTIDDNLGGLYSYDEDRFIRGLDNDYIVTKQTLLSQENYEDVETQTNDTMQKGIACKKSSIFDFFTEAKQMVATVLTNLEEQTILGYNIQEVINYINGNKIDNEIFDSTDTSFDIKPFSETAIPNISNSDVKTFVKWAVSIATVILFINHLIVQVGGDLLSKAYPALIPLITAWKFVSGALLGIAFEILFEHVIKNDGDLSNVNLVKLLIVGIAGGISSFTGIVGDAFIGGITSAIFSFMDGSSILKGVLSFIQAVVISLVISFTITVLVKPISAIASKIATKVKINKATKALKEAIGDSADEDEIKKMAAVMVMRSNIADATTDSLAAQMDIVKKSYIKQLPADDNANFCIKDSLGRVIKKSDLYSNDYAVAKIGITDTADDSIKKAWVKSLGSLDATLDVVNGEIQMDKLSIASVKLIGGALSDNRNNNFRLFRQALANQWIENPDLIPDDIKSYFISKNVNLDYLTEHNILDIQNVFKLTIHEAKDGTMYLVTREIHQALSHSGGIMFVKYLIANSSYFLNIVSFA